MKKVFILTIFVIAACVASSAKSKKNTLNEKKPSPVWMTDEGRLSMFPSTQFLSALSYGSSAEVAQSKAAEQLSEYIKSHVESSVDYCLDDNNSSVSQKSSIKTDNLLYSMEYTTAFYSESLGMYCVVAYIDRDKAYDYVKPKLNLGLNVFVHEYQKALEIEDDFEKILGIQKARTVLPEFYEVYDFARAISPKKTASYENVNLLANESIMILQGLRAKNLIYVQVEGDIENRFKSCIEDCFTDMAFGISDKDSATCICECKVNFASIQKTETTYEVSSSYSLIIKKKNDIKLSFSKKLDKQSGFDFATAKRRAVLKIENELKKNLMDILQ
jgi:hypothetical protein